MAPQLHLQRLYCLLQVNVLFPQLHIFFALSGHHFPARSLDDTPQLQGVHCALLEDISSVYSVHWTHYQTGQEQALQQDPHQAVHWLDMQTLHWCHSVRVRARRTGQRSLLVGNG